MTDPLSDFHCHQRTHLSVSLQGLRWMDTAKPCLIVSVHNKHVHQVLHLHGMQHREGTVSPARWDLDKEPLGQEWAKDITTISTKPATS